jgi:hypothetical protein
LPSSAASVEDLRQTAADIRLRYFHLQREREWGRRRKKEGRIEESDISLSPTFSENHVQLSSLTLHFQ